MYKSGVKFEELSEKAKQQARETYDEPEEGTYTLIDDVIIMRNRTKEL